MAKKRILFICKGHPNIAGAQRYLYQVAALFPESVYELHYAFFKGDGDRVFREISKHHAIKLWGYDWRHLSFAASFKEALTLFKRVRPEMVLFNSSEDQVVAPLWAAILLRIAKRVMVVHWAQSASDLPLFRRKGKFPFFIPSRYALLTRGKRTFSYAMFSHLIFVNNMTREAYRKLYKVRASKAVTIYNGIGAANFRLPVTVRKETRSRLGLAQGECMLLATGNLAEVKGYPVLINALKKLEGDIKGIRCFIAGQGQMYASLQRQISATGLSDTVSLLDYRDDIPELLSAADIFCMPSLNEALGYSLLEALASGVPVIASRVGGIPEVITHGQEGLLVPPGNPGVLAEAIKKLVTDETKRLEMGRHGVATVDKKFTVHEMLKATRNFLHEGSL